VIRLPDSVNTKPERGDVVVSIVDGHPERRNPVRAFAWLESQPYRERIGGPDVVTLNGNEQHPLPPRTEQYVASGAHDGSRNSELFAAACQMRDAGYSQSDAERELIPRHVADGNGTENPAAREKEAKATIASAYSRPPREPIPQAAPSPKQQIDDLLRRYRHEEVNREQPSAEQIAEAVRACARLDPVQWVAERKRLKSICGEDFRLADLDRLYREARRDLEREAKLVEPSTIEHYLELDGCMVYEQQTPRGTKRQIVADWTGHVLEWITRSSDEDQSEHIMRLQLDSRDRVTTLEVSSELFGDANALQRFIAQKAGVSTPCVLG
jgi:hypothetical protein